jgi:hypothetical protein
VALTFDDGWSISRCARIVRTLRAKHAPATFFLNASVVERDPIRWRSLLEGFEIANHTVAHKDLSGLDAAAVRSQIANSERIIEEALGRPMLPFLRPPYGAYDRDVLRIAAALGYHTVLWDTDSGDGSSRATTRAVIRNGKSGRDGAIVLLHCGPGATPAAVGPIIDAYRRRGYRLVGLERMLEMDPPAIACRVIDDDRGVAAASLREALRDAAGGARLFVQGTCLGTARVREDLEIVGHRAVISGTPTLDGAGGATVVTVRPGATVTIRDVAIRGGGRGIVNGGSLVLEDVLVTDNRSDGDGGGIHNAAGGTLTLSGTTLIGDNTAVGAGGGVFNAGTLMLTGTSSIVGNIAGAATIDAGVGPEPTASASPGIGAAAAVGPGGGVMNVGGMVGAVCGLSAEANIRANRPDDCAGPTAEGPSAPVDD